ncbi:methyl-accepting chemotaxis protein [Oceanimonas sp. GK1]|uniref:HAMP domain-containing methyl-accepting chemotaxis protein n=1 Tax=Oceanimonas sp. (strain GK1 / IBRC-M 10197) TaxID=511062 RepID=UPI0002495338|nr:methyl-accepting chemotaxis protein [Oceanimonas sp. GK1]AEY02819.1 methyl-accepting chemotaxis protein [Oceanimonas sp. GK1]
MRFHPGNLSVRVKLILGFVMMLLTTLAIAAISGFSLNQVLSSADRQERAASIDLLFQQARQYEKNYLLQHDDKQLEQAKALVSRAGSQAGRLLEDLQQGEDRARLEQLLEGTQRYQQELERLGALKKQTGELLFSLNQLGFAAQQRAEYLSAGEPAYMSWLVRLVGIRLSQQEYVISRDESEISRLASRLKGLMLTLESRLKLGEEPDVREFYQLLGRFDQQQQQYIEVYRELESVQERIGTLTATMAESSAALVASQKNNMATVSQWAGMLVLLVTVAALVMGALFAWLITQGIVNPLKVLMAQADRIAGGDLTQNVTHQRRDELGRLMDSMQTMTQNLRSLVGELNNNSSHIATSAQSLSAMSEQGRTGTNQQRLELEQVSTAMNEMAATVQEVARHAEAAFGAAQTADSDAVAGNARVSQTTERISALAEEVRRSLAVIQQLETESLNIGGILDVIKGVAEQTNLLALNAAIEAARAGEHGRGFAVVADEVRALAQRTQQATAQIEGMIQGLQGKARESVTMMDHSAAMAEDTVATASETGNAIQAIARAVSQIQQMNSQIATAAEQQSSVAEEINRSVFSIRELSEHSAAASDEAADNSAQLAGLGNELQQLVGRFRLPA